MTARVINDPSALGWEYDPDTGRWTWGGGSSSGGGNGTFPEAPVDGQQYARQDAGWAVIVHPDGGGGDVDLSDYYTKGECNSTFQPIGDYLTDAVSNGNIYGRQNGNWVVVPTSGGGGGVDLSAYYTKTESDARYQPKGNYLTSESDPVFKASPAASITQNDINNWNNPPSGGGDDPNAVKLTGDQTINGVKTFAGGSTYFKNLFLSGVSAGGVGISGAARIEFSSGATTLYGSSNTLQVNSGGTSITGGITCTGPITGTDCIASSDERLKDNITTAPVGLIDHLKGREWDWLETREKGSGVVAQELEQVLPHLVHEDDEGMKSVSYNGLVAYLIEEVKALKAEVEILRNG